MTSARTLWTVGIIALIAAAAVALYVAQDGPVASPPDPQATSTPQTNADGLITLKLNERGVANGVTLTPREVIEDSRCPTDVQCIQAGRVRLRATLTSGLGTANQVFLVGEPITTEAEAVTLVKVEPVKVSTVTLKDSDYRFTFKVEKRAVLYINSSANLIKPDMPPPGAVVGKSFRVSGQARGNWYFEASFPVEVLDKDGKRLAITPAQAQGEWMTTNFVPYLATITVPESYIGPATVVLHKDNPSGLPAYDASASYRITIEY